MTTAVVLLAAGSGSRFDGQTHKLRADLRGRPVLEWSLEAVRRAGADEIVVVTGADPLEDLLAGGNETILHNPRWADGQATSLAVAVEHAAGAGHDAVVVGLADQPLVGAAAWKALLQPGDRPIRAARFGEVRRPPTRLDRSVWDLLPSTGDDGARLLLRANPELVEDVVVPGEPIDVDTTESLELARSAADDLAAVRRLLGREPMGRWEIVVRDQHGGPVVLRNDPVLADGRPMPTRYWLCGERENLLVGRLESHGGVRRAEAELGLDVIAEAHDRYAAERDAVLDDRYPNVAHRPTGGVGGTRVGVKCLHAHFGWWLAGGDDPVGQWVADHLHEVEQSPEES